MAQAPPEVIEAAEKRLRPQDKYCEIWEENWPSWQFFLKVQSQWILVSGMAGAARVGLDYSRVESTMRIEMIPRAERKALFADLRVMEFAVLAYDSEKKN